MKKKIAKPTLKSLKAEVAAANAHCGAKQALVDDLRKKLDLAEKNTRHLITRLAQEQQISSELQSTVDSARKRIEQLLNQLSKIERNRFARQLKRFLRLEK